MSKRRQTDYRRPRVFSSPRRHPYVTFVCPLLRPRRLPLLTPAAPNARTTAFPCLRDALAASPEMYLPKSASVEEAKKKKKIFWYPSENRAGQANTIRFLVYFLHGIVFPKVASVLPRRACPLRCQPTSRPWSRTARRPPRRWWGPRCAPCTASPAPEGRTRRPPESSTPRPAGRRSGSPW